jgi:hypothetical protein
VNNSNSKSNLSTSTLFTRASTGGSDRVFADSSVNAAAADSNNNGDNSSSTHLNRQGLAKYHEEEGDENEDGSSAFGNELNNTKSHSHDGSQSMELYTSCAVAPATAATLAGASTTVTGHVTGKDAMRGTSSTATTAKPTVKPLKRISFAKSLAAWLRGKYSGGRGKSINSSGKEKEEGDSSHKA